VTVTFLPLVNTLSAVTLKLVTATFCTLTVNQQNNIDEYDQSINQPPELAMASHSRRSGAPKYTKHNVAKM